MKAAQVSGKMLGGGDNVMRWRWIFTIAVLAAIVISAVGFFLLPNNPVGRAIWYPGKTVSRIIYPPVGHELSFPDPGEIVVAIGTNLAVWSVLVGFVAWFTDAIRREIRHGDLR